MFCIIFSTISVYPWLYSIKMCLTESISKIHNRCTFICFLSEWPETRRCFMAIALLLYFTICY